MKQKIFFSLFLIFGLLIYSAIAESETAQATPKQVQVGLYILNLGKFDVATGTFTADFYLNLKCDSNCSVDRFEFMNGRAATTDKIIDTPNEKFYRIQANLNNPVDLKNFPFDSQKIQIILEDKDQSDSKLQYVPIKDQSGIDKAVSLIGWNLNGWSVEEKKHEYSLYGETYSQYVFTMDIARLPVNSFIKTILPVLFIVIVILSSFVLDTDKINTRLTMAGSSLVASVMFHVSINNQIPPVGYLTFGDKFMILTYIILVISFITNIVLIELIERKKTELAEKIHRMTEFSVLIIFPLMYVLLFLFLF
jgi:hypothetical protein